MRKTLAILSFLICAPIVALSDDLLSCVNPDVKTALLSFGYQAGSEVTDEMPTSLSVIRYPEAFGFIGSMTSEHLVSAAFRTGLDPESAESILAGLYGDQGWRPMPRQREHGRRGFREPNENAPRHVRLCSPEGNGMTIMAREIEQRTFVTLFSTNDPRNGDCNQEPTGDGSIRWGFTEDLMPDLELPRNSKTRGSGHGGIIQASGDDAETHARVLTELQPEELLEHFSSQLITQGWLADATWIGESSQGSTWSLRREGLPRTVGNLQLVTHSPNDYSVRFTMLAM